MAILVIEDEPGIADFVRRGLEAAGFSVEVESDGQLGLEAAQRTDVQLVVLDLGLPGLPGEEVLTRLRTLRPALPVIVLTAKAAVSDRVANLDAGADDYLVKPFSFSELLARVRARLRSPAQPSSVVLEAGGIRLDVRTREATVSGQSVRLSSREFSLLEVLLRHPGQVLSQTQLLDLVWGYDFEGASNVVETYVRHLRRKLGPERIETVRRAGYRLVSP
ncbi:response regulator transcription factor [uncultured Friedmanniella sp.]|uniref:response regulator transcription factor n=1 Tax=uncultured Friedmanniella sp. TaxID=335381 RepID=UPI0035CBDF37